MFKPVRFYFLSIFIAILLITNLFLLPVPHSYAQSICGAIDIVFVIDDTGSMSGALSNVSMEVTDIIDSIGTASNGDFQLGLVTFKDTVTVLNDLAPDNRTAVEANINSLRAGGGGNRPEASDEALNTVVNGLDESDRSSGQQIGNFNGTFRTDAIKIIVLITDAPPAGFDNRYQDGVDDVNAHARAVEANTQGIRISSIYISGTGASSASLQSSNDTESISADTIEMIMRDYADTTGGLYIRANSDGTGTSNAINNVISSCGGVNPTPAPPDPPAAVPEPMTIILLGSGITALGAYARKRRKDAIE